MACLLPRRCVWREHAPSDAPNRAVAGRRRAETGENMVPVRAPGSRIPGGTKVPTRRISQSKTRHSSDGHEKWTPASRPGNSPHKSTPSCGRVEYSGRDKGGHLGIWSLLETAKFDAGQRGSGGAICRMSREVTSGTSGRSSRWRAWSSPPGWLSASIGVAPSTPITTRPSVPRRRRRPSPRNRRRQTLQARVRAHRRRRGCLRQARPPRARRS